MKKHYNQTIGFADRLNQVMYDQNMNATQLGKLVGMERKTVYTWTCGYSMPNSLILAKICKTLNVSADYLLFGSVGEEEKARTAKNILKPKEEVIYLPAKDGLMRMTKYSNPLPTKNGYIQLAYRGVVHET